MSAWAKASVGAITNAKIADFLVILLVISVTLIASLLGGYKNKLGFLAIQLESVPKSRARGRWCEGCCQQHFHRGSGWSPGVLRPVAGFKRMNDRGQGEFCCYL